MLLDDSILVTLIVLLPFISVGIIALMKKMSEKAIAGVGIVFSLITAILVFLLVPDIFGSGATAITESYEWIPSAGIVFGVYIDPLALLLAGIAAGIGFLVVVYSTKYMEGKTGQARYYALVMLFIGAMICLVLTDNLLVLYIFWEIVGLCSYALIAFDVEDKKAANAGIKAFVTTRIGDIGLIIGIFVLYVGAISVPGTTTADAFSIQYLIAHGSSIPMHYLAIAAFAFIIGAMGKSAQLPLHAWLPDAMEAPTTISALIHAATMVNAGIYVLARMAPLFVQVDGWTTVLLYLGGITALVAATMALVEPDLKRLLAYSTISQLGYMVFAIGLGLGGVFISGFHLMNHAIFKALLFLCAGAIIHSIGTRNMYEMRGLRKEMPKTHIFMLFGTLALAGIPIFSGFWSKDLIFHEAYTLELTIPLILVVLTAVLTAAYSFRMYFLVFGGESRRKEKAHPAPAAMWIPLALLGIGAIISWLLIDYLGSGFETFGFTDVHAVPIADFIMDTFSGTAVLLSLLAILLGIGLYFSRNSLKHGRISEFIIWAARKGFGFNWLYNAVVRVVRWAGMRIRNLQTGDVNVNTVGFVLMILIILLLMLFQGVL
jgi:NADH-quinone oxidoreductase subunit L